MSSNGYAVLHGLSQKVAARTVQVTVVPRPIKFTERRAVLQALQRFASVEMFKKLDNHDSSFISVLGGKSQVEELVGMSPLHYQIAVPRPNGSVKTFLTSATSNDPIFNSKSAESGGESQTAGASLGEDHKDFTLHIFPAPSYIHSAAIKSSPLHGRWPEPRRDTIASKMLKTSLPKDVTADGLSDWETGRQVPASARGQLWQDILLGSQSFDVSKRAINERIRRREQREEMPPIFEGLLHLQQRRGQ